MRGPVKFHCGDRVCDPTDPRHTGRVTGIINTVTVRVQWDDTGWISEANATDLERVRSMTREEAMESFRTLVRRHGLQWRAGLVPPDACQTMLEIHTLLNEKDLREALGLPR
jgi:hypothetical protein